jgi:hypothetical protein
VDLSRLSQGDKIAAISAVILLAVMSFFSWFEATNELDIALSSAPGLDTTPNAWQAFQWTDLVLLFTCFAAIVCVAVKAAGAEGDFPLSTIVTLLGAISTIFVLYRVVDPPRDTSTKLGVFLGLISAAALTYGGWLAMQSEGTSFDDAANRLGGGGGDVGGPGPGAPPSTPPPPPPPSGGNPPAH